MRQSLWPGLDFHRRRTGKKGKRTPKEGRPIQDGGLVISFRGGGGGRRGELWLKGRNISSSHALRQCKGEGGGGHLKGPLLSIDRSLACGPILFSRRSPMPSPGLEGTARTAVDDDAGKYVYTANFFDTSREPRALQPRIESLPKLSGTN